MRFLLDVNASGSVAHWLLDHGHDVALVQELDPRMSDDQVLQRALAEKRIIVITDRDFEELIWHQNRRHEGILRLENLPCSERLSLLEYVLTYYAENLVAGSMIIASSHKIRIRTPAR